MTAMPQEIGSQDELVSLRELIRLVWISRWWILLITFLFALMGAGIATLVPRKYDATVLLAAVSSRSGSADGGSLSSAVSQLSGFASLAGLNLGSDNAKAEAIATLQSEALTTRYIRENNLLPVLFKDQWDAIRKTWKSTDPKSTPTEWMGNQVFSGRVRSVKDNAKTGLFTLTIRWDDPQLAARWANGLVKLTNDYLRTEAIEESQRNVNYLNEQAAVTNIVEVRSAIYKLMESEIKKQMLARGSEEYGLKVIDPASVPEAHSFPKRSLWTFGSAVLGLMVGVIFAASRKITR